MIDTGMVIMGTIQRAHLHDANCTNTPPRTNPAHNPRVPAAANLHSSRDQDPGIRPDKNNLQSQGDSLSQWG